MFDEIRCNNPLPDGFVGKDFQTQDFKCVLDSYTIAENGVLTGPDGAVYLHGWLNFYTSTKEGGWHEYNAKFTDGQMVEIRTGRQGKGALPDGESDTFEPVT